MLYQLILWINKEYLPTFHTEGQRVPHKAVGAVLRVLPATYDTFCRREKVSKRMKGTIMYNIMQLFNSVWSFKENV